MSEIVNFENEVWRVIDHPSIGCYDNYAVSNYGRVKSLRYRQTNEEKLLKIRKNNRGYLYTVLSKKGFIPKKFRIHRLVALMFLNPDPNLDPNNLEVNHLNEIKTDNRASNLEFCDRIHNIRYGTGIERRKETRRETLKTSEAWKKGHLKTAAKLSKQVFQYSENGELVNIYPSVIEAARQTGYNQGSISNCCRGRANTAYNFVWSYIQLTVNQVLDLIESGKISKLCKKVYQYPTDGTLVNVYPSVKEAAQQTGFNQSNISACCQSERTAYGYIFRYEPITTKKIS